MHDYRSPGEQILSGVFITLWLLSRPFVWMYHLLHWFVLAVAKEAGNKVVKVVGGVIGLAIIGYLAQLFFH